MRVNDLYMVMLRAHIAGENQIIQMARHDLPDGEGREALAVLLQAAFAIAAYRKFSPRWTRAEVIRFVADTRAQVLERPDLLDPVAGEEQIRYALGDDVTITSDTGPATMAQLILLDALIRSLDLGPSAIDDLLDEARQQANRVLSPSANDLGKQAMTSPRLLALKTEMSAGRRVWSGVTLTDSWPL